MVFKQTYIWGAPSSRYWYLYLKVGFPSQPPWNTGDLGQSQLKWPDSPLSSGPSKKSSWRALAPHQQCVVGSVGAPIKGWVQQWWHGESVVWSETNTKISGDCVDVALYLEKSVFHVFDHVCMCGLSCRLKPVLFPRVQDFGLCSLSDMPVTGVSRCVAI